MLKFLFYGPLILVIIFEITVLTNPKKFYNFKESYKKAKKKSSLKQTAFAFLMLFYIIWILIGLLSSQWLLFGIIIILGLLPYKRHWILLMVDAFLTLIVLITIILNTYHFHVPMLTFIEYFKTIINW